MSLARDQAGRGQQVDVVGRGRGRALHGHGQFADGLVTCERRGSSVMVSRSVRGHELVDLLAD